MSGLCGRVARTQRDVSAARGLEHARADEKPCSSTGVRPSSAKQPRHGVELDVGRREAVDVRMKPPVEATLDASGPLALVDPQLLVLGLEPEQQAAPASSVSHTPPAFGWSCRSVPTRGSSWTTPIWSRLEQLRVADARQHQQLRRVVGARGEDHLAVGAQLDQLGEALALDADRAAVLEQHAVDLRGGSRPSGSGDPWRGAGRRPRCCSGGRRGSSPGRSPTPSWLAPLKSSLSAVAAGLARPRRTRSPSRWASGPRSPSAARRRRGRRSRRARCPRTS